MSRRIGRTAQPSLLGLVDSIIENGFRSEASEIHLCRTDGGKLDVKYQENGRLIPIENISEPLATHIITRIKIMSGCSIAKHTEIQHGKGVTPRKIRIGMEKRRRQYQVTTVPGKSVEGVIIKLVN